MSPTMPARGADPEKVRPVAHHTAALMHWHHLGPEYIPGVVDALKACGLPELEVTDQDVRTAYLSQEVAR